MESKLKKAVEFLLFDINFQEGEDDSILKENLKVVKESGYNLVEAFNIYHKEYKNINIETNFDNLNIPKVKKKNEKQY